MTRAPYVMLKPGAAWRRGNPEVADTVLGWRFVNPRMPREWTISLGMTAEVVAERKGVTREEQDRFALESQRKAARAVEEGRFDAELAPVEVPVRKGPPVKVERDEHPRPGITLEKLARLRPVFKEGGTVTAGNSSGINDGAAALLVTSPEAARREGWEPLARIAGTAVAGVSPDVMGLGPVPAVRKLLGRLGWDLGRVDAVELNEAFAAQSLACIRDLDLDPALVNPCGGAIALGHPLGATGAKLLTTLVHHLRRTGGRYGVCTMCIGVGQGIAMGVERL